MCFRPRVLEVRIKRLITEMKESAQVMLKRSKTILDVREQEAECARRGGNPSAMWCPRSSPTKRTPLQRGAPQRGQDDRSSTPTAENELRRLRWHRGEWMPDRKGRPKPVVDCTQQMPCKVISLCNSPTSCPEQLSVAALSKFSTALDFSRASLIGRGSVVLQGAVRRSQVSISDRVVLSNGGNGMEHFASAGFYEVRTGPTQGDSFLLCLVFSLLEQLLGLPMNNHEPAGVDVPRGEDVCEPGLPVLTRTQAVDNCRSRVRRMGR